MKTKVKIFNKKTCKKIAFAVGRSFSEFNYIPSDIYGGVYCVTPMEEPELFIRINEGTPEESFLPIPTFFVERVEE